MDEKTKKSSPIFIAIIILIIGTIAYNFLMKEPETYLTKGIDRINRCIAKTYTPKPVCSSAQIDSRDVYTCTIGSTKLVYEIKDMGQDSFSIYALNGKAKQLANKTKNECPISESLDYEFANKAI
ncbi:MAG: hypothetical protein ACRCXK_01850 [Wohlfahrtiimonas sp.]